MRKFLKEVNRRNVSKVAVVYIIVAWFTMQVVDVMFPALNVPDWTVSAIAVLLLIGFPFALIFAWAYELTPEGLKREQDVDRSQSITSETGKKLNYMAIVVLVLAVGFLLADRFMLQPGSQAPTVEATVADVMPSIAVLPFVNMSGDKENEYFSDGLAEELLNALARIPQLHVAGRTSSFQFKGTNEDLRLIGQKLNVANVLEGSVRKSGTRLRITAQLIDTESGYHLWSNTYDRELTDIFAIQDEIAANVVDALKVTLLGEDAATANHGTDNPEAHNLYLQALYFEDHTSAENLRKAEQSLKQAIGLDPGYAQAHALLAVVYQLRISGFTGEGTQDFIAEFKKVHEYAQNALDLDPNLPEAHIAKGMAFATADWNRDAAERHYLKALELAPNHVNALGALATVRFVQYRLDEATVYAEKALQLDPLSIGAHRTIGNVYREAGRIDDAISVFRNALRLQPDSARIHSSLVRLYLSAGELEKAAEHTSLEPVIWARQMFEIIIDGEGRDTETLQAAAKAYEEQYGEQNSYQLAEIYGSVGDLDNAFKWLEKCQEVHDPGMAFMQTSQFLASARNDPRWPRMLELAGF